MDKHLQSMTFAFFAMLLFALASCSHDGTSTSNTNEPQQFAYGSFPTDRLYTETHEWIQFNGGHATVGVTPVIFDIMGGHIERFGDMDDKGWKGRGLRPETGTGPIIIYRPAEGPEDNPEKKEKKTVLMPVGGYLDAFNLPVIENVHLFNHDVYGSWLFFLSEYDANDIQYLLTAEEYQTYVNGLGILE